MPILFFLVFLFSFLFSAEILVDPYLSPYAGASDLITVNEGFAKIEDVLYKEDTENPYFSKIKRIANQTFIILPVNSFLTVVQHEYFGHGYRIRQIGSPTASVKNYRFNTPVPYGSGGGSTSYSFNDKLTIRQQVSIAIAGLEANTILANRLKLQFLSANKMPFSQNSFYEMNQQSTLFYIALTHERYNSPGNDVAGYIYWMNRYFPNHTLSLSELKTYSWLSLVDPFTFFSYYAGFYYMWTGKEFTPPLIKTKNVQWMPNLRYSLSPSGPEVYLESFFKQDDDSFYAYVKYGNYTGTPSFGAGFEHPELFRFLIEGLGLRVDLFRELMSKNALSSLDYFDPEVPITTALENFGGIKTRYGYGLNLIYHKKIPETSLEGDLQLGYKSVGYIPGESLNASIIARLGMVFEF